ncbi:MAG: DUF4870 domain-containing protein, partial [Actinomycetaceae bacterium]|nr:DUF4870 domain-containing protein [Actinomycetaceae bacterium]
MTTSYSNSDSQYNQYSQPQQPAQQPANNRWDVPTSEERTWAIFAHLSAVVATIISVGWLNFLGPLVIWLIKKDSSPYVRRAAAQSFNFNLGMWLMSVVGWILVFTLILAPVGLILFAVSFILTLWHHIRAAL